MISDDYGRYNRKGRKGGGLKSIILLNRVESIKEGRVATMEQHDYVINEHVS